MREILFRGKRVDNGEWVEGYYVCISETYHYILTGNPVVEPGKIDVEHYKVIPETVGQYTGLTDKNGKRIFEGDIVKGSWNTVFVVFWDTDYLQFRARTKGSKGYFREIDFFRGRNGIEVIGNIHDNQ